MGRRTWGLGGPCELGFLLEYERLNLVSSDRSCLTNPTLAYSLNAVLLQASPGCDHTPQLVAELHFLVFGEKRPTSSQGRPLGEVHVNESLIAVTTLAEDFGNRRLGAKEMAKLHETCRFDRGNFGTVLDLETLGWDGDMGYALRVGLDIRG